MGSLQQQHKTKARQKCFKCGQVFWKQCMDVSQNNLAQHSDTLAVTLVCLSCLFVFLPCVYDFFQLFVFVCLFAIWQSKNLNLLTALHQKRGSVLGDAIVPRNFIYYQVCNTATKELRRHVLSHFYKTFDPLMPQVLWSSTDLTNIYARLKH